MPAERVRSDQKSNDRAPQPARASSRFVAPAFAMEPLQALAVLNFSSPARPGSPKSRAVEESLAPISASWPIRVEPTVFSYRDRQRGETNPAVPSPAVGADWIGGGLNINDSERQAILDQVYPNPERYFDVKAPEIAKSLLTTLSHIVPEEKRPEYERQINKVTTLNEAFGVIIDMHIPKNILAQLPQTDEEKARALQQLLKHPATKLAIPTTVLLLEQALSGTAHAAGPSDGQTDWLGNIIQVLIENPSSAVASATAFGAGYGALTGTIAVVRAIWDENKKRAAMVQAGNANQFQSRINLQSVVGTVGGNVLEEATEWFGLAGVAAWGATTFANFSGAAIPAKSLYQQIVVLSAGGWGFMKLLKEALGARIHI